MTDRVRGAFGSFTSSGHRQISYINTRFDHDQVGLLRTARQVFPREELKIRELIQRDIDDERVRTDIVGYLTPGSGGEHPRFFPPIVAAVVTCSPGVPARIAERYPATAVDASGQFPRRAEPAEGIFYEERYYGDAFGIRIPILREDADTVHFDALFHGAELSWHRDKVRLVAIDGQHRLVAIQAVLGYLDESEAVRGYDKLKLSQEQLLQLGLRHIPVCIVFAPLVHEGNRDLNADGQASSGFQTNVRRRQQECKGGQ